MMVLVIRHVALEGYKYIRRSGNIVCVFMCKVDIDSWPSYYFNGSYYIYIYIYIFDKNFNNRYFITLEITLIHTVDIEDNKYYLNNIMEKVIPQSKTKFLQNFF